MRVVLGASSAFLLIVAGCAKPETPEQAQARMAREVAAARPTLDTIAKSWERYASANQPDSIAMLFTEQGEELAPNAPPLIGRPAIQAYHAQQLSQGSTTLSISTDEVLVNGPLAVSRGGYILDIKPRAPAGAKVIADTGKYLLHFHQVSGKWLVADLAWNSNIALPAPAPAAAKPAPKPRARTTTRRTR